MNRKTRTFLNTLVRLGVRLGTWSVSATKRHWRGLAILAGVLIVMLIVAFHFAKKTVEAARIEEVQVWVRADRMDMSQRAKMLAYGVRTGRVPSLLPLWNYDQDQCAAVAWKYVAFYTRVKLSHGNNGAAWMLRSKNPQKLRTVWDATARFNKEGSLGAQFNDTTEQFREAIDQLDPNKMYLVGVRWEFTESAKKIKRDRADLNSHVAVFTRNVFIHKFTRSARAYPLVVELQEQFLASGEFSPVWIAEVRDSQGRPVIFPNVKGEIVVEQRIMPWLELHQILRIPDVLGGDVLEKVILYWVRGGYDQYPRLPE